MARASKTRAEPDVRAAGGIVVRSTKKGSKVLLVHRERYDDWSFPKGKLDLDETYKAAALREVEEETGFICKAHRPRLPSVMYTDGSGRRKEVRYWLMTVKRGKFEPNDEVDAIEWLRPSKVEDKLTYPRDRKTFRDLLNTGRLDN